MGLIRFLNKFVWGLNKNGQYRLKLNHFKRIIDKMFVFIDDQLFFSCKIGLKQKSIPIFTSEKRKAFHRFNYLNH